MKPLTETYRPKGINSIQGQEFNISKITDFIINFKRQKKKSIIIYGASGTGKTCSIYAIANDLNLEILELNASDYRNSQQIESIIRPAMHQKSFFFKGKVIVIDELDGILSGLLVAV